MKIRSLRCTRWPAVRSKALEFEIGPDARRIVAAPLQALPLKKNILITAVLRHAQMIIPGGRDQLQTGDFIIVLAPAGKFTVSRICLKLRCGRYEQEAGRLDRRRFTARIRSPQWPFPYVSQQFQGNGSTFF